MKAFAFAGPGGFSGTTLNTFVRWVQRVDPCLRQASVAHKLATAESSWVALALLAPRPRREACEYGSGVLYARVVVWAELLPDLRRDWSRVVRGEDIAEAAPVGRVGLLDPLFDEALDVGVPADVAAVNAPDLGASRPVFISATFVERNTRAASTGAARGPSSRSISHIRVLGGRPGLPRARV